MMITRRLVLGLPALAFLPLPVLAASAEPRKPYVKVGAWVHQIAEKRILPGDRESRVLKIHDWNGEFYPVDCTGYFEDVHQIADTLIADMSAEAMPEDYWAAHERHWQLFDSGLPRGAFLCHKRGLEVMWYKWPRVLAAGIV